MGEEVEELTEIQKQMTTLNIQMEEHEAEKKPKTMKERMYCFQPYERIQRGPPINVENFEIKPELILLIMQHQFGGSEDEDPNIHLMSFVDICGTIKIAGVPDEAIKLLLFTFSLRDKAKTWFMHLDPCIQTWDDLCREFIYKFFPANKIMQLRREIHQFTQSEDESFYEAWERCMDLVRRAPRDSFTEDERVQIFYHGLNSHCRMLLSASAGGSIRDRSAADVLKIIERMASTYEKAPSTAAKCNQEEATNARLEKLEKTLFGFMQHTTARLEKLEDNVFGESDECFKPEN